MLIMENLTTLWSSWLLYHLIAGIYDFTSVSFVLPFWFTTSVVCEFYLRQNKLLRTMSLKLVLIKVRICLFTYNTNTHPHTHTHISKLFIVPCEQNVYVMLIEQDVWLKLNVTTHFGGILVYWRNLFPEKPLLCKLCAWWCHVWALLDKWLYFIN